MKEFDAAITSEGDGGSWPCIWIPFDVETTFGKKGRVAVKGMINGHPFRSSIFSNGSGSHLMMVNKDMRAATGVSVGSTAHFTMEPDNVERTVSVPDDLAEVLEARGQRKRFDALSYSHRKQLVDGIEGAKKPETRAARVLKAVEAAHEKAN